MIHEYSRTIISFIFVLGVLVTFHEFGHYIAARWRGVHVDVFSIGFGKVLYARKDRRGTEWRICAFPLGGYVKPHGFENPDFATPEQKAEWIEGKTFHDKPVLSRVIVVLAGPLFNFILAYALFVLLFATTGRPHIHKTIAKVVPQSSAVRAGLHVGDEIEEIDHQYAKNVEIIHNKIVAASGKTIQLQVKRDGHLVSLPVQVSDGRQKQPSSVGKGQIGVVFGITTSQPLSVTQSLKAGGFATWDVSVKTLAGVWQILTGQHTAKDLGGPLRIAQLSGEVSQYGFASLISFMALLSVNLGLINLFPVPLLDGGRLLFYLIEAARGEPVSTRTQEISFQIGFAILAGLFLFSTVNDLSSFGLFKWVTSLFS